VLRASVVLVRVQKAVSSDLPVQFDRVYLVGSAQLIKVVPVYLLVSSARMCLQCLQELLHGQRRYSGFAINGDVVEYPANLPVTKPYNVRLLRW
jgi:hypothetical protein